MANAKLPSMPSVAGDSADALGSAKFYVESLGALAQAIALEARQDRPNPDKLRALEDLAGYLTVDWSSLVDAQRDEFLRVEHAAYATGQGGEA